MSAAENFLISAGKSMSPAKEILHSVQEKTCTQLHPVQCGGMNYDAMKLIEKLNDTLKSDELRYSQKETAESVRARLTRLETTYRTAINECIADLETVGVRL